MSRIAAIEKDKATKEVKEIYGAIEKTFGRVPNIFQNMGNSAAALRGFLELNKATEATSLTPKLREEISLAASQSNQCNYCLSAHTAAAQASGVSDQEIILARKGQSKDPKTQAILNFVKAVVEKRGHMSDQDIKKLKTSGVSDQELVEIVLIIATTTFTNYFNQITETKIDFPVAPEIQNV